MSDRKISKAVIHRLPRYYRYLSELADNGTERISSGELSERMHVTASQIRQDLNNFGGFGQQGYGYQVDMLKDEIGKILGLDKNRRVVIIGAGNLGQALSNYPGFEKRGFKMVGIYDIDEDKQGKITGSMTIQSMDKLYDYLKENIVEIAALTVPKTAAITVAKSLTEAGVRGFWNFSSAELTQLDFIKQKGITVENVHLAESLMRLSYALTEHDV